MRPFRFRLAKLKEHRGRVRRDRARTLAEAEKVAAAWQAELDHLRAERGRVLAALEQDRRGVLDLRQEACARDYLLHLDVEEERVQREVVAAHERLEATREGLREAMKELRVVEVLEDHRRAEHDEEERRQEDRLLDTLAIERRRHRPGEGGEAAG